MEPAGSASAATNPNSGAQRGMGEHVSKVVSSVPASGRNRGGPESSVTPQESSALQQARQLALTFEQAPHLIVCSPFLRVRQTATPTNARVSSVPIEEWPVQEFTYLYPALCVSSTVAQRRPMVEAYWNQADPNFAMDQVRNHLRSSSDACKRHWMDWPRCRSSPSLSLATGSSSKLRFGSSHARGKPSWIERRCSSSEPLM